MNEIWVMSVRTSLPYACEAFGEMKLKMECFDSFEKAKAAFRETIKHYAFSKNSMFNKKGRITLLEEYINGYYDEEDEDEDGEFLTRKKLVTIQEGLTAAFSGKNVKLAIPKGCYTDWMIGVLIKRDYVEFFGDGDGPINGYTPTLKTNIFSMEKEQDYYLYIDNRFGQMEASSELYIDLKKVTVH